MEFLILGLLMLSPMTGYQLQQFIKENLALICSHSAGSVQTALSKLEREGFVSATASLQGKRRKKVFSITPSGREAFSAWVAQPMQAEKVKNMELAHLFFLGLAQPEERKAAIQNYIRQMEETSSIIQIIRQRFQQAKEGPLPPGTDWETVFRFQEYTLEYGIAAAQFQRDWYRQLLCKWEETL